MRPKSLILLVLALGCGLIASIGITQVMAKRAGGSGGPSIAMQPIFVAMQDLPMGDPVTAQTIKLEEWPKDKVPPGALGKLEDVEGRRPKSKIYAGSPILDNQLLGKGENDASVTRNIPSGFRVVAVRVDDVSGSAALLRPGDRVDVLVHLERNPSKEIHETSTRTLLQDIKIFAVDQLVDIDPDAADSASHTKTVSLLVSPDQAEIVMLATEMGRIRLVMRGLADDSVAEVDGKTPQKLFGDTEGSLDRIAPVDSAHSSNKLLAMFGGPSTPVEPAISVAATPAGPLATWTVRVVGPSKIDDVVLESDDPDAETAVTAPAKFSRWRTRAPAGKNAAAGDPVIENTPSGENETTNPTGEAPTEKSAESEASAQEKQNAAPPKADK